MWLFFSCRSEPPTINVSIKPLIENCKIIGYDICVNAIRVIRRFFHKLLLKQKEPKLILPETHNKKRNKQKKNKIEIYCVHKAG